LTSFPYYPHWKIDANYEGKPPFMVEVINGVRVIRSPILLPGFRKSAFRRILFDSSIAITTLMASAAVGGVDTVICVSPPLQLGLTAWLVARLRRARFLLHLQDLVPDAALSVGLMRDGNAVRFARGLERFVYSRAQRITVVSQGFVDNLVSKGVAEAKLQLLPNWVDTGRFKSTSMPAVRAALGAGDGDTLVLYTGNMGAKQGLETVVDAASELADERVMLTFVGDGNRRPELESRAARLGLNNVRFVPLQTDLPGTLAAADLLVLAQRGQVVDSVAPSKLLSYMAAGKPIVAAVNKYSEAGRLVREADCGIVVPPDDPVALAAALRHYRNCPEEYSGLGEAGRRHVAEYYERSHILEQWSKLVDARPGAGA